MPVTKVTDTTELIDLLRQRDMRFVDALLAEHRPEVLEPLVAAWLKDRRAWAWSEADRYFLRHKSSLGHELIVKRLIRHAVAHRRDHTVAAAMVFCDRLVTRRWKTKFDQRRRDWITYPSTRRDTLPKLTVEPTAGRRRVIERFDEGELGGALFRYPTRYYLRRKTWRFFRDTAQSEPRLYVESIGFALRHYQDQDTQQGIVLMQRPALLRICFGKHPGLRFDARRPILDDGHRLADVIAQPNPSFASLWRSDPGRTQLARVAAEARSQFIRNWAEMLNLEIAKE